MYTPMAAREMVAGAEFLDVRLLDQVDDPLRRTVEEQMRAIAQAKHGDKAEEIFDPNIWHAMDRYLSKVGEGVRRSKVMPELHSGQKVTAIGTPATVSLTISCQVRICNG